MGEVNLVNVSKRFTLRIDGKLHDVRALDRVSFSIHDGEIVALIGPSGCGKTTALRIAMRLETAAAACVAVDGREVKGCGMIAARPKHGQALRVAAKTRPALTGPPRSGCAIWRSGRKNARGAGRTKECFLNEQRKREFQTGGFRLFSDRC